MHGDRRRSVARLVLEYEIRDQLARFDDRWGFFLGDVQTWFPFSLSKGHGECRPARWLRLGSDYQGGIRVADIPAGPLVVFRAGRFAEVVL